MRTTVLPSGGVVSTIKLGYPQAGYHYETMVFPDAHSTRELDSDQYHTKEEALVGHKRMVKKWTKEDPNIIGEYVNIH